MWCNQISACFGGGLDKEEREKEEKEEKKEEKKFSQAGGQTR